MSWITKIFCKPTIEYVTKFELEEAKRCLLKAQADAAYHASLALYYTELVSRLSESTVKQHSETIKAF